MCWFLAELVRRDKVLAIAGGVMIFHSAHTVGGADGRAGLVAGQLEHHGRRSARRPRRGIARDANLAAGWFRLQTTGHAASERDRQPRICRVVRRGCIRRLCAGDRRPTVVSVEAKAKSFPNVMANIDINKLMS